MSDLYFILKDIEVHSANVSSTYLTNSLSTASLLGFSDAFLFWCKTNAPEEFEEFSAIRKVSVIPVLQDFNLHPGKKSFPGFHSKLSAHKSVTPSDIYISESNADLKLSIFIKIPLVSDPEIELSRLNHLMSQFLKISRLSGGKIIKPSLKSISSFESKEDFIEATKTVRGWTINDMSNEFDDLAKEKGVKEAIREFTFTYIHTAGEKENFKKTYYRKQKGFNFLTLKGYQFLEEPKTKVGSRMGHKHAYAEPIITVNRLEFYRANKIDSLWWKWEESNDGLFLKQ